MKKKYCNQLIVEPCMGKLRFTYYEKRDKQVAEVNLSDIYWGGMIKLPIQVNDLSKNKILYLRDLSDKVFSQTGEYKAKGPATGTLCVYSKNSEKYIYMVMLSNKEQIYKRLIRFEHEKENAYFTHNFFCIDFVGSLSSNHDSQITVVKTELLINKNHVYEIPLTLKNSEEKQMVRIQKKVPIKSIISKETEINNSIKVLVTLSNGIVVEYAVGAKGSKPMPKKFYYCPIDSKYYKDYALAVRKNVNENFSLVVRPKDPIEYSLDYRIKESKLVSFFMYHIIGKLKLINRKSKVNLYYEKASSKAEEGTFELFEYNRDLGTSRNYYILSKDSEQWKVLSKHKNVVKKYSWKYYFLIYSANNFIATEGSAHLNVFRSINVYVRKTLLESNLIFLQHGIIYMKNLQNSAFAVDMESEPKYMVVASEKEANVVSDILKLPKDRLMVTGQPVFSTIEANHIDKDADDYVTIMLTWKDWEEYMLDCFEESTYYKYVCEVYEEVSKLIPQNKIRIVPHPKVKAQLLQTSLADMIWEEPISLALEDTKLLITDYSSICYNAFYRGAAIIFYQPDVDLYEEKLGKLIPNGEEYVGYRSINKEQLRAILENGITDCKIDLNTLRSQKFVKNYKQINEYNDGKNIYRISDYLREKGIV